MRSRLDQIEARLQSFIESSLGLFPEWNFQDRLARLLVNAMEQTLVKEDDGSFTAASQYVLYLNPRVYRFWLQHTNLVDALRDTLLAAAQDNGIRFPTIPEIILEMDEFLPSSDLRITASFHRQGGIEETGVIPVIAAEEPREITDPRPKNAFLILEGGHIFPLRLVVMNIGRRLDNQLVIDDSRVSRNHAQLRAVRGHYFLFDLNSTGGSFINGQRITQQILKPGDVISLAGVSFIYGEETSSPDSTRVDQTGSLRTENLTGNQK